MIHGICGFCKKEFRKRENKYIYCSILCANRYNLNGLKPVSLPKHNIELAELIGICLGDGYTSHYQVGVALNSDVDKEYIPYVFNLCKKLFPNVTISQIYKMEEKVVDIRISSRVVADFMRSNGIIPNAKIIPNWIKTNHRYIKACIRGLFDTEGSISFKKYLSKKGVSVYKQLNFRNYNTDIMRFVMDYLVSIGLKPTTTLKSSLYLSNNNSIDIYRNSIGFSNPKLSKRSYIRTNEEYIKFIRLSRKLP